MQPELRPPKQRADSLRCSKSQGHHGQQPAGSDAAWLVSQDHYSQVPAGSDAARANASLVIRQQAPSQAEPRPP